MSRWPDRVVRLAARSLPVTIRDRYREEWRADVAAAATAGIRPTSVAVGALVFSATLDRDAPEISGAPIPVIAQRHARWAVALMGVAGVLAISSYLSGRGPLDRDTNVPLATLLAALDSAWMLVALACIVAGLVQLWRAARLSSALSRISALLGTVGLAMIVGAVLVPTGRSGVIVGLALIPLLGALVCGGVAWGSAMIPSAPRPVVPVVKAARRGAGRPRTPYATRTGVTVAVASIALLALVGFGTLELFVLSPTWMAPGYSVEEIYAALSDGDRTSGIVMILGWTVFWSIAALAYLAVGLVLARHANRGGLRIAVLAALSLVAAMAFFHVWAGFSIGNSISDTLPPMTGGASEYARLFRAIGEVALVIAVIGWIAPRRRPEPRAVPA